MGAVTARVWRRSSARSSASSDGVRDARPPHRQLRTTVRVLGRGRRFSLAHIPAWLAVPPVAWGLAAGDARQLPEGRARLPRAHGVYIAYFVAACCEPDWARRSTAPSSSRTTQQPLAPDGDRAIVPHHPVGQFFIQAYIVDKRISIRDYVYTKVEVFIGAVFTTPSTCSSSWPAPPVVEERIVVDTAQDAARALAPLAAGPRAALRIRPPQRLDPRRGDPAADHRLRGLRGFGFEAGSTGSGRAPVFNGLLSLSSGAALIASSPTSRW